MKNLIVFILYLSAITTFGQNKKIDSLHLFVKKEADIKRRAYLLNELSVEFRNTDFNKSIGFAEEAFALAKQVGDVEQLGRAQLYIGVQNYYLGKYEEALKAYLAALKIYEDGNNRRGMSAVLNELGTFNKKQGDLDKSQKNFEQALNLATEIKDSSLVGNSLNNLGIIYEMKDDYTQAMVYFKKSTVIKEAMNDLNGVSYNYDNMGTLQAKLGNFNEAESYLTRVIDIRNKLNDRAGYAISLNNLGEMFMAKKDYNLARKYLLTALELTYETHYKDLRRYIFSMLSETYRAEGNYKESYQYLVKSNEIKDSIFTEQKSRQLLELQTKYETEKKEQEISIQSLVIREQDLELQRNQVFMFGLASLIILLSMVGILFRSRLKLKERQRMEQQQREHQEALTKAVIELQERERSRFAQDLHDGFGQLITALRFQLENPTRETENASQLIGQMRDEIRNVSFALSPQVLVKEGLIQALTELAARLNKSGKVNLKVQSTGLEKRLPGNSEITIYRLCQEWLNNVLKYSKADKITLQLVNHPDELVVTIEDDGEGFSPSLLETGKGNGWKNIQSRALILQGEIDIDTQDGRKGTTFILHIPKDLNSLREVA